MTAYHISGNIFITDDDIDLSAIRSQGSGGQNVNKVSSAVHLRFDVRSSGLPEDMKTKLLKMNDTRLTKNGEIIIKSQEYRTREKNTDAAIQRLCELIANATKRQKKRRATKPTKSSVKRRLDAKNLKGKKKALRGKVDNRHQH